MLDITGCTTEAATSSAYVTLFSKIKLNMKSTHMSLARANFGSLPIFKDEWQSSHSGTSHSSHNLSGNACSRVHVRSSRQQSTSTSVPQSGTATVHGRKADSLSASSTKPDCVYRSSYTLRSSTPTAFLARFAGSPRKSGSSAL